MVNETTLEREARQREEKFILQKEKIEALSSVTDRDEISKIKQKFKDAEVQMNMRHLRESASDLAAAK